MLENGSWIWSESPAAADSYAEFYDTFFYRQGKAELEISCDSNYAVYLNGTLAAFGQYADFEHYKVADRIDLTPMCRKGKNDFAVVVWYYGVGSSTYCVGKAGLIFQISGEQGTLLGSGAQTACRRSRAYRSGAEKKITWQLGFSFCYDASAEDGWMTGGGTGFAPAVPVEKSRQLHLRPNRRLELRNRVDSRLVGQTGQTGFLFDLQQEQAGFLELELNSPVRQKLVIAYGEHLRDGHVARRIGERDFSVEYICRPGQNCYMNPFRRLGCRYLEVFCEEPIEISYLGIRPTMYPLRRTEFTPSDPLDSRIYQICVRSLELCLHEHYEDCPWREQAFYTMDSRNQMLCGYIAFQEYRAARAGLQLFAQDRTDDRLLSICCPKDQGLCIPSFSLHYFTAVDEYTCWSADLSLAQEVYGKLCSILQAFLERMEDGLVPPFRGKNYWNFYEWRTGMDGRSGQPDEPDLILNALLVLALEHMESVSAVLQKSSAGYGEQARRLRRKIRRTFFREQTGLYSNFIRTDLFSELGNALAVLCGASCGEEARQIAQKIMRGDPELLPATLSMNGFVFDALLQADRSAARPFILARIRRQYQKMLDCGATTAWEDEEGAEAFDGAGSLCHGWSALPVYYYHLFAAEDAAAHSAPQSLS
ncbi:MAG: family 78 glycoside hydrolase catalytic domain [Firmicutes bacterium]|nr:family 78 glycoside hydrolase catalytic domain [Bacillota bacterium]